jgi:hypothetical protein
MRFPLIAIPLFLAKGWKDHSGNLLTLTAIIVVVLVLCGVRVETSMVTHALVFVSFIMITAMYINYKITFSDSTVFQRKGLFSVSTVSVERKDIDRTTSRQNIVERILNLYSVDVYTLGNSQPTLSMEYITPNQIRDVFGQDTFENIVNENDVWERTTFFNELKGIGLFPSLKQRSITYAFILFTIPLVLTGVMSHNASMVEQGIDVVGKSEKEALSSALAQSKGFADDIFMVVTAIDALSVIYLIFVLGACLYYLNEYCNRRYRLVGDKLLIKSGYLIKQSFDLSAGDIKHIKIYKGHFSQSHIGLEFLSFGDKTIPAIGSIEKEEGYRLIKRLGFNPDVDLDICHGNFFPSLQRAALTVLGYLSIAFVLFGIGKTDYLLEAVQQSDIVIAALALTGLFITMTSRGMQTKFAVEGNDIIIQPNSLSNHVVITKRSLLSDLTAFKSVYDSPGYQSIRMTVGGKQYFAHGLKESDIPIL